MEDPNSILKLADLLNLNTNQSDSDEDEKESNKQEKDAKPSDIGVKSKRRVKNEEKESKNIYSKLPNKIKEEEEEFECLNENAISDHWKKTPQWDITYKQSVTPSDVYLQMSGKTPSSFSCENLVLTIYLPEEKYQNMDLKVEKESVTLTSPNFKLKIPLPHPVDPKLGNAKWDEDTEKLTITLKMDREFDFVNF